MGKAQDGGCDSRWGEPRDGDRDTGGQTDRREWGMGGQMTGRARELGMAEEKGQGTGQMGGTEKQR